MKYLTLAAIGPMLYNKCANKEQIKQGILGFPNEKLSNLVICILDRHRMILSNQFTLIIIKKVSGAIPGILFAVEGE